MAVKKAAQHKPKSESKPTVPVQSSSALLKESRLQAALLIPSVPSIFEKKSYNPIEALIDLANSAGDDPAGREEKERIARFLLTFAYQQKKPVEADLDGELPQGQTPGDSPSAITIVLGK